MVEIKKKSIEAETGLNHKGDVLEFPGKAVPRPEQDRDTLADSVAEAIDPDALKVPPIGKYATGGEPVNYGEEKETLDKIAKGNIASEVPLDIPRGPKVEEVLNSIRQSLKNGAHPTEISKTAGELNKKAV